MSDRPDVDTLGEWLDDVFIFHEPITLNNGVTMKTLDFSMMQLPPDISRREVLEAMTDPNAVVMDAEVSDDLEA